jgi:hypothetical protein
VLAANPYKSGCCPPTLYARTQYAADGKGNGWSDPTEKPIAHRPSGKAKMHRCPSFKYGLALPIDVLTECCQCAADNQRLAQHSPRCTDILIIEKKPPAVQTYCQQSRSRQIAILIGYLRKLCPSKPPRMRRVHVYRCAKIRRPHCLRQPSPMQSPEWTTLYSLYRN